MFGMIKIFIPVYLYLRVAPFPHLTSVKIFMLSWLAGTKARELFILDMAMSGWACLLLCVLFLWGIILCQADALSRFQEFRRLLVIMHRYGFRPRFFRLFASSRCQRDAALVAAKQVGHSRVARDYFKSLGYKWYHILPDTIIQNPLRFFHPGFLKFTFIPRQFHKRLGSVWIIKRLAPLG
ncbi:hypothetical protein ACTVJH_01955 [Desulfoplanes sp. PS50]|jgi:hypothetical protein